MVSREKYADPHSLYGHKSFSQTHHKGSLSSRHTPRDIRQKITEVDLEREPQGGGQIDVTHQEGRRRFPSCTGKDADGLMEGTATEHSNDYQQM